MHSPSLSLCPVQGTVSQERKKKSVIQDPAVWLLQSPVNPKPCGTFSWPTSKSPFSPFSMAAKSLLLPKPRGKKKKHSKTSWSSLLSFRTVWYFHLLQNRVVYSLLQSRMDSSLLQSRVVYSFLLRSHVVYSFYGCRA